jgi:hypothetical protein
MKKRLAHTRGRRQNACLGIFLQITGVAAFIINPATRAASSENRPIYDEGMSGINFYTYCNNNPVNCRDPRGLEAIAAMAGLNWGIQPYVPVPGQLTLTAANQQWQQGNGAPLNIDINTLDLSNVQLPANSLYRAQPNFDGSSFSSANDALVYGTVTLYPGPNNTVIGGYDTYNFDYKDWSLSTAPRNIATFFAKVIAGNGTPYKINFTGTAQVGKSASGSSGASNATNQAANAAAAAVNSAMDNVNSIINTPIPAAPPISMPSSGTTYPLPPPPNFNDEEISAADGGFILYPNMSNTSQIQSVYSKH